MSKHLYEEALVEVKQLKQLAEDNARRAVMEELEPKIKQLIERQLLEVDSSDAELDELAQEDVPAAEEPTDKADESPDVLELSEGATSLLLRMVGGNKSTNPASYDGVVRFVKATVTEAAGRELATLEDVVKGAYVMALNSLPAGPARSKVEDRLDGCYAMVQEAASKDADAKRELREASLNIKITGFKEEAIDEDTLSSLQIEIVPESEEPDSGEGEPAPEAEEPAEEPAEAGEEPAGEEEADFNAAGLEEPPGEEKPEEPVKKEGKNMDQFAMLSDDTVVEIDEGMLRREIARMKALREAKEGAMPKNNPKGHGAAKMVGHFGGGTDEGDAFEDGEVTTADDDDLMESMMAGKDETMKHDMAKDEAMEGVDEDSDPELDEVVFELMGEDDMPAAAPAAKDKDKGKDEGMGHGAMATTDEEVEEAAGAVDEDELGESGTENSQGRVESEVASGVSARLGDHMMAGKKMAGESHTRLAALIEAKKKAADKAGKAKKVANEAKKKGDKKMFEKAAKVFKESVQAYDRANAAIAALNESTRRSNSGAKEVETLRNQLAETNLFNAKLLYTNKLLQNEALSPRQKVAIIEKLDEARSLREAKLVYESLTRTIASGKASVNEGADRQVLGSASRATRPSSTVSLNEGVETSRWARLAGISK